MRRGVKRDVLVAAFCVLAVFALPAFADSQARIVRLSYLDGEVSVDRNLGQGLERAITNMPITQGMMLQTADDGEAEVEFEDGSTFRLTPDSKVLFQQLSLRGDGGKLTLISGETGTLYFDVKHHRTDDFRIALQGRDVRLNKDAEFRIELTSDNVRIAVTKGEVALEGGDETTIKKNQTVAYELRDPQNVLVADGVDQSQYDWWNKERSDNHDQYAYDSSSQYQYGGGGYDASVPAYGWSDLNQYGSFFLVPGYGYMWRPYGVAATWDPFMAGYWMFYPGFGYTWVSPYAWGWMPYRYGSWNYMNGYGWAWRPGNWNRWRTRPPVVNPPRTYVAPKPPSSHLRRGGVVAVGDPGKIVAPHFPLRPPSSNVRRGGEALLPPKGAPVAPANPTPGNGIVQKPGATPLNGVHPTSPIRRGPAVVIQDGSVEPRTAPRPQPAPKFIETPGVPPSLSSPIAQPRVAPVQQPRVSPVQPPTVITPPARVDRPMPPKAVAPQPQPRMEPRVVTPPSQPRTAPTPSAPRPVSPSAPHISAPSGGSPSMGGGGMRSMGGGGAGSGSHSAPSSSSGRSPH